MKMTFTDRFTTALLATAGLSLSLLLAGCGAISTGTPTDTTVHVPAGMQGVFMGGQQPVANVSLQLYAASTSGYGGAATPLLAPGAVKTTVAGNFILPVYTCPSASSMLYLVGTGGQPIMNVNNSNLAMMVGLGSCSEVMNSTAFIVVNEVSTVATIWALSPFMTGIANVGTSSTNALGLTNAFAAINKIVDIPNGVASGPALPAGAVLPIAEINTLADMLEQCVNSSGGAASDTTDGMTNGTGCGKLFYLAPNAAGTVYPTDTITAALNIAQSPARNTAKLNNLRSAQPVFQPVLSVNSPPAAWTIAITYNGGGLNNPKAIAVDASGNVWTANAGNSTVTKLSNTGAAISTATGFTGAGTINVPAGIAIDQSGYAWVTNMGNNTVSFLTPPGTNGHAYSGNGLNLPQGIAIDAANNAWVTNTAAGSGLSAFNGAGTALAGSPYTGGGLSTPPSIAISAK